MRYLKGLLLLIPFFYLIFSLMVWSTKKNGNATRYDINVETRPSYNTPAEHKTEAYVMHDEFYLTWVLEFMK